MPEFGFLALGGTSVGASCYLYALGSTRLLIDCGVQPGLLGTDSLPRLELLEDERPVALLAQTSTTWYTWLEQGRDIRVSASLLDRLAGALQLDYGERLHLFALGGQPLLRDARPLGAVSPAVERFIHGLSTQPAYVLGPRGDYLVWNDAAAATLGDIGALPPRERNVLHQMFLEPAHRSLYTDWAGAAEGMVARFRAGFAPFADDPWFRALVEELRARSPEFRRLWAEHDVKGAPDGLKDLRHPEAGRLLFEHLTFRLSDAPDLRVVVYTPLPEYDTPVKLSRLLAKVQSPQSPRSTDYGTSGGSATAARRYL